jgi:adenylate cyclase
MSAQVFACGGTIEKFIGDAMLATFGVPDATGRDAHNALKCADLMVHELEGWNFERQAMGEAPVAVGIGLNYGPAVIGDIGRGRAVSFAVIGDTVNTASRLQTLTRGLNAKIVASDSLVTAIREIPDPDLADALSRLQDGGEVSLKGRAKSVRIWLEPRSTPAVAGSSIDDA